MGKYKYIYCNKCKDFYLRWSVDFGNSSRSCSICYTKNIKGFSAESFSEMAIVERMYKILKIIEK